MTDNTEIKTEPEPVVRRGRGRPKLSLADRKPKPKDLRRRKAAPREDADNTNKLQCFRCFVWLSKDKFDIKRNSGKFYKACKNCTKYMADYRVILRARALQTE